jgi:hypothetical protein
MASIEVLPRHQIINTTKSAPFHARESAYLQCRIAPSPRAPLPFPRRERVLLVIACGLPIRRHDAIFACFSFAKMHMGQVNKLSCYHRPQPALS